MSDRSSGSTTGVIIGIDSASNSYNDPTAILAAFAAACFTTFLVIVS